tara:strand:- start:291 stop:983 length:693 start_codon:yes stop_codon:yes gene_type:complete
MKIASNYKEIISLWEKEYPTLLGKWITREVKQDSFQGVTKIVTHAWRQKSSFVNAIILLEPSDWDQAIKRISDFESGKKKREKIDYWNELKTTYLNQLAKDQNCITLQFGGYIEATYMCFERQLKKDLCWGKYSQNISRSQKIKQNETYLMKYGEEVIDPLNEIDRQLIEPMNSYFLCKKDLAESEKVMNMVRLSLSNGETLGEVAESMFNIQRAAKLIAGEQREELVNT